MTGRGAATLHLDAHVEVDAVNPNVTVGYLAEQINRSRLDHEAARNWRAAQAAAHRSPSTYPAHRRLPRIQTLIRPGERLEGLLRSPERQVRVAE